MRRLLGFVSVLAIGCDGIEAYEVPPAPGAWSFEIRERYEDGCDTSELRADMPLAPEIASVAIEPDEGGFWLTVNDGEPGFCTQDGGWFECAPAIERLRVEDDLTVSLAVIASGYLVDGTGMDGEFSFDYVCKGAGCSEYEQSYGVQAPCRVAGAFEAEKARVAR